MSVSRHELAVIPTITALIVGFVAILTGNVIIANWAFGLVCIYYLADILYQKI